MVEYGIGTCFSAILAFILIKYCEREICNMEYRKFNQSDSSKNNLGLSIVFLRTAS